MSQVLAPGVEKSAIDAYQIGWYVESADEETYGPVSRKTLGQWLQEGVITPNTLVRHCTQPVPRPVADQARLRDRFPLDQAKATVGDRMEAAWPRKSRDRLALAEDTIPCAWHNRPATLVCIRCLAPYCGKDQMKPLKKPFFLCRHCQANLYNRRVGAWILDNFLLVYVPIIITSFALVALGVSVDSAQLITNLISLVFLLFLFFRDSLLGGAGPGKRMTGLRVVQSADGSTPLTNKQGLVRWLSQFIPFFNLYDAAVPFRDPLLRRVGDKWAKTRVLDTPRKLEKARAKVASKLLRKGLQPPAQVGLTMEGLARLA
jgi:uncharacterized RDD family membrane protein YckC